MNILYELYATDQELDLIINGMNNTVNGLDVFKDMRNILLSFKGSGWTGITNSQANQYLHNNTGAGSLLPGSIPNIRTGFNVATDSKFDTLNGTYTLDQFTDAVGDAAARDLVTGYSTSCQTVVNTEIEPLPDPLNLAFDPGFTELPTGGYTFSLADFSITGSDPPSDFQKFGVILFFNSATNPVTFTVIGQTAATVIKNSDKELIFYGTRAEIENIIPQIHIDHSETSYVFQAWVLRSNLLISTSDIAFP